MSQYYLVAQNGRLTVHRPERAPPILYSAEDRIWAYTHIDEIEVEISIEQPESLRLRNLSAIKHVPPNRRGAPSRRSAFQYTLVNQNGVLGLKYRRCHHQHTLSYRCDNESRFNDEDIKNSSVKKASFLVLPVELRIIVYRHLFVCYPAVIPHPIWGSVSNCRIVNRKSIYHDYRLYPQILVTCRQINWEATPILYSENMFEHEHYWPFTWKNHILCPVPLSDTCRLGENVQFISRIQISQQYRNMLLGDGQLKISRSFPSLSEVKVTGRGLTVWRGLVKSLDRRQPKLKRAESSIYLDWDDDYIQWRKNQKGTSLDFSLHKKKKREIEKWMDEEQLFVGRHLVWSFETMVSEYCGLSCTINFVADDKENADSATRIPVKIMRDGNEVCGYEIA